MQQAKKGAGGLCGHLLRTAAFVLILLLLLQGLGLIFRPKDNTKAAGFRYDTGIGYLAEPENTIDVVFLGDSRAYSSFVPLRIWQEYGIASCICSTPAEYLTDTLTTLEQVLERQNPKVVVLETNAVYEQPVFLQKVVTHWAEQLFPFLRYHDRWKSLTWADFTEPVDYRTVHRDKGYQYDTTIAPAQPNDHMAPNDAVYMPSSRNISYIRGIQELCRQQGAQLVLFTAPTTVNWFMANHNAMAQLAGEMGISYIDCNTLEILEIDWNLDTSDGGDHMNYSGASKITDYFGAWLWDMGLFADKREDPAYASWNGWTENFQQMLEGV